ncbi:MAG: GAF domain-containing sensor histidine kinase [Anaerolineae bacterium]|nr:GAF domain-containing sensor histidine kinase [Anaerolineae bacterium]
MILLSLGFVGGLHYLGLERNHVLNLALPRLPAPLTRHSLERVLLVFPAIYASYTLGIRAGMLTLLLAVALMLPRALFISAHPVDATLETAVVAVVAGAVMWLTEVQERERRLRERTLAELETLHAISDAAVQSLQLGEIVSGALQRIASLTGAEAAWVYLLDDADGQLRLAGQHGPPEGLPPNAGSHALGTELSREALASGEPIVVDDISAQAHLAPMPGEEMWVRGFLAVPLAARGRSTGTLCVATAVPRRFTPDEVRLLATIANHLGVIIENARLYEGARQSADDMQYYVRQVTRAQEDERLRIARELHDETVQALILLSHRLDALAADADHMPGAAAERIEELHELTEHIIQGVRRFTRDLRPPTLDHLGLLPALQGLVADLQGETDIESSVEVVGEQRRLAPEVELVLFRIVQEALSNARRHSGASHVSVLVEFHHDRVTVTVKDDGKGFHVPPRLGDLASGGKLGLMGMHERARLLGGTLEVHSAPGAGTSITASVPA